MSHFPPLRGQNCDIVDRSPVATALRSYFPPLCGGKYDIRGEVRR